MEMVLVDTTGVPGSNAAPVKQTSLLTKTAELGAGAFHSR